MKFQSTVHITHFVQMQVLFLPDNHKLGKNTMMGHFNKLKMNESLLDEQTATCKCNN